MTFALGTFNCRDFFDDVAPHVIGNLDREGFGAHAQRRAKQLYRRKVEAVAAVVARMNADAVAFQEVEGVTVLEAVRAALPEMGYLPAIAGAADQRGIACGLLTRLPVRGVEVHGVGELAFPAFQDGDPRPFAGRLHSRRGLLEVDLTLPDGSLLTVMVAHLKSARPVPRADAAGGSLALDSHYAAAEGAARAVVLRLAEALQVRSRVDARLHRDGRAQIAVLGDLNDNPEAVTVRAIAGELAEAPRGRNADLDLAASLEAGVLHHCVRAAPPGARHTLLHRGAGLQFDHVLASRALWRRFRGVRVLNESLREGGDGWREEVESDHAAVVANFA
ncbi:MAG: endonuclease/exonuclease/phosphatase family protein [Polyangiales bacterium]